MSQPHNDLIRNTLLGLLGSRAPHASVCPSEVARAIGAGPDWRTLMPTVVAVARDLARRGAVRITQGSAELPPDQRFIGPIRVRRGTRWAESDGG